MQNSTSQPPEAALSTIQNSANDAMTQLASVSEQVSTNVDQTQVVGQIQPERSSFVDADAAFASGAAAYHHQQGAPFQHPPQSLPTANNIQAPGPYTAATNAGTNIFGLPASKQGLPSAGCRDPSEVHAAVNMISKSSTSLYSSPAPSISSDLGSMMEEAPPSGPAKKKRKSGSSSKQHQLPMFLTKTYHMIEKSDPDIATWSENGDNFVVKNVEKFASSILPQYFKHANFSSFARQLNFYGFRKLKAEPILTADYDARTASYVRFYHEKFQKDKPELLVHIKRATKADVQSKDDVESLRHEIQHLNDVIAGMQNEFDRKLSDMYMDINMKFQNMYDSYHSLQSQLMNGHGSSVNSANVHPAMKQATIPVASSGKSLTTDLTPNTVVHGMNAHRQTSFSSLGNPPPKKAGTDMMQMLSQATMTLKSPALPAAEGKVGDDKFTLK